MGDVEDSLSSLDFGVKASMEKPCSGLPQQRSSEMHSHLDAFRETFGLVVDSEFETYIPDHAEAFADEHHIRMLFFTEMLPQKLNHK